MRLWKLRSATNFCASLMVYVNGDAVACKWGKLRILCGAYRSNKLTTDCVRLFKYRYRVGGREISLVQVRFKIYWMKKSLTKHTIYWRKMERGCWLNFFILAAAVQFEKTRIVVRAPFSSDPWLCWHLQKSPFLDAYYYSLQIITIIQGQQWREAHSWTLYYLWQIMRRKWEVS